MDAGAMSQEDANMDTNLDDDYGDYSCYNIPRLLYHDYCRTRLLDYDLYGYTNKLPDHECYENKSVVHLQIAHRC